MEPKQGQRGLKGLAYRLSPFLIGAAVLYPASVAVVAWLMPAGPVGSEASRAARLLVSSWQVAFLLAAVLVPLFLNRSLRNNLTVPAMLSGALRSAFLIGVSAAISVFLVPSRDAQSLLNIVNFHIFLSAFAFLLGSVFYLGEGLGAGGNASQFASTLTGFAMIGTVFYWDPLIEGDLATESVRNAAASLCIGANPVIVAMHNFMGIDFFHIEEIYSFSALAGYYYQYPSWQGTATWYLLAGSGLAMCSMLAYMLRVVLPENLLQRDVRVNRERKLAKISEWQAGAAEDLRESRPVLLDEAPAEAQAAPKEQSILESLFGSMEQSVDGGNAPAPAGGPESTAEEDSRIAEKALIIDNEIDAGESWEEKAAALGLTPEPVAESAPEPPLEPAAEQAPEPAAEAAPEPAEEPDAEPVPAPAAAPEQQKHGQGTWLFDSGELPGPEPAAAGAPAPKSPPSEIFTPPVEALKLDADSAEPPAENAEIPPDSSQAGLFDFAGPEEKPRPETPVETQGDLASALAEFGSESAPPPAAPASPAPGEHSGTRQGSGTSKKEIKTGLIGNLVEGLGDLDTGRRAPARDAGGKGSDTGLLSSLLREMNAMEEPAEKDLKPPGRKGDPGEPEEEEGQEDAGGKP